MLPLGRPRNQIVIEKHIIARGGFAHVRTTGPVTIGVDHQLSRRRGSQENLEMKSAPDVAQNLLESYEMRLSRIMHIETDLLNRISNICPGKGKAPARLLKSVAS